MLGLSDIYEIGSRQKMQVSPLVLQPPIVSWTELSFSWQRRTCGLMVLRGEILNSWDTYSMHRRTGCLTDFGE